MLDLEGNTAVVSKSECDKNDGNLLLCCYRCQANTNRMDLKFRTVEGQNGTTLRVYITPLLQPKCCQLKTYAIHPLSLHMIVQGYDETRLIKIKLREKLCVASNLQSFASHLQANEYINFTRQL
jgi:Bardet-Biedl syndrome 7 protein